MPVQRKLGKGDYVMKKGTAIMVKMIGLFLSVTGLGIFSFLMVAWSVEEYSTYPVPVWPMALGIVIAILGFICVKSGMGCNSS